MAAFGVQQYLRQMPSAKLDEKWSVEALTKHRERVESYGISLDMMPITMTSASIDRARMPAIMLGQSPERDRNIEDICTQIRNCAKAGFPVKYNFTILGIPRSGRVKGRPVDVQRIRAGQGREQRQAEHRRQRQCRRLLGAHRLIPRARRAGCRGVQGEDGLPSAGSRGAEGLPRHRRSTLATPAGLKRFVSIKESPYHGLNFCQGTVSEQLEKPGEQIYDVIRSSKGRSSACTSGTSKAAT